VISKKQFAPAMSLFRVQQSKEFRARDEKLPAQRPARLQFSPLDEPIDAEIIHA